ncbi:MAG: adenylate/guanylate cyclase domain-containing protein [Deltaproteobacteria bacterium]
MIFSLQRRFLISLLIPVTLVVLVISVVSFMYARTYLLDQWESTAMLKLEKTAHQIQMRLAGKKEFIELIVEADGIPNGTLTQAFLAGRLAQQPGVHFVDIESLGSSTKQAERERVNETGSGAAREAGYYRLAGYARQLMNQGRHGDGDRGAKSEGPMMRHGPIRLSLDTTGHFLSIVTDFADREGSPSKRIAVLVGFNSFMKDILQIGQWKGSYACLVTSDGTYLAHTNPSMSERGKLGETGDPLEKRVLEEMKTKSSGTIFGEGNPPTWVMGFYRIPTTDWYLILSSRGSVVLAPILRFRFNYALVAVGALICIGVLIRSSTHPVVKSIGEISEAAGKVETGDYTAEVAENRSDEIGELKRRFNQMVVGLRQRDLIERTFGRYVDKKIARELMSRPEALRLGGQEHVVTILMTDLRGFTPVAEKLPPEQVIKIMNRHFSRMIPVIEKYVGIIVDFYGDGMLAFFDGLETDVESRAGDAVKAALEMQQQQEVVSRENEEEGLPRLSMGIGIHTGEVVVGNVGSESRASYGIVGSAVNETQRIQSFAKGGMIMISQQTYETIADRLEVGPKCRACLKGLEGSRDLYPVLGIDEMRDRHDA